MRQFPVGRALGLVCWMLACDDAQPGDFGAGAAGDGAIDMARTDIGRFDASGVDGSADQDVARPDAAQDTDMTTRDAQADLSIVDAQIADMASDGSAPPCEDRQRRPCAEDCPIEQVCADGAWLPCDLPAETCNGQDDDCDRSIDEAFPGLGGPCNAGVGACMTEGVVVCNAGSDAAICNATPRAGEPELCNGLDDDCDGQSDEGFDLQRDPLNCGACGRSCSEDHVEGTACDQGRCQPVCLAGWANDDGDPANGCPCPVQTRPAEVFRETVFPSVKAAFDQEGNGLLVRSKTLSRDETELAVLRPDGTTAPIRPGNVNQAFVQEILVGSGGRFLVTFLDGNQLTGRTVTIEPDRMVVGPPIEVNRTENTAAVVWNPSAAEFQEFAGVGGRVVGRFCAAESPCFLMTWFDGRLRTINQQDVELVFPPQDVLRDSVFLHADGSGRPRLFYALAADPTTLLTAPMHDDGRLAGDSVPIEGLMGPRTIIRDPSGGFIASTSEGFEVLDNSGQRTGEVVEFSEESSLVQAASSEVLHCVGKGFDRRSGRRLWAHYPDALGSFPKVFARLSSDAGQRWIWAGGHMGIWNAVHPGWAIQRVESTNPSEGQRLGWVPLDAGGLVSFLASGRLHLVRLTDESEPAWRSEAEVLGEDGAPISMGTTGETALMRWGDDILVATTVHGDGGLLGVGLMNPEEPQPEPFPTPIREGSHENHDWIGFGPGGFAGLVSRAEIAGGSLIVVRRFDVGNPPVLLDEEVLQRTALGASLKSSMVALGHHGSRRSLVAWLDAEAGRCDNSGARIWVQVLDEAHQPLGEPRLIEREEGAPCAVTLQGSVLPAGFRLAWVTGSNQVPGPLVTAVLDIDGQVVDRPVVVPEVTALSRTLRLVSTGQGTFATWMQAEANNETRSLLALPLGCAAP